MKKIIAISLMFALVATAVFADTSIGGGVTTHLVLATVQEDGGDPMMAGEVAAAEFTFTGSNAEGTLGGRWRFRNHWIGTAGVSGDDPEWQAMYDQVYVWWKPVPQINVFLGIDQDGKFGAGDFLEWGFHTGDQGYITNQPWDFWRQIFPGNWDGFGLALSFYPIPGLDINLVLPTGSVSWQQAPASKTNLAQPITDSDSDHHDGMLPSRLRLNVNYSLDFGKISFAYFGAGVASEKGTAWLGGYSAGAIMSDNNGLVALSALITAIDGIQIKVGGSVALNNGDADMLISAGGGVAYAGDGFGVKFRAATFMQGDRKTFLTTNVMPYFDLGGGQFLLDIGVTSDGEKDPGLGWYFTPFYRLGIPGGGIHFGLKVWNNIGTNGDIGISGADFVKWAIPIEFSFSF